MSDLVDKIDDFRPISCCASEIVQDYGRTWLQLDVLYGLLNGTVSVDIDCSLITANRTI